MMNLHAIAGDLDLNPDTGQYRISANVAHVEANDLRRTLGVRPPPLPVGGALRGVMHCTGPLEQPIFSGAPWPKPSGLLPVGPALKPMALMQSTSSLLKRPKDARNLAWLAFCPTTSATCPHRHGGGDAADARGRGRHGGQQCQGYAARLPRRGGRVRPRAHGFCVRRVHLGHVHRHLPAALPAGRSFSGILEALPFAVSCMHHLVKGMLPLSVKAMIRLRKNMRD